MTFLKSIRIAMSLSIMLFVLISQTTHGAQVAGHVILAKGDVSAVDTEGQARKLKRRSEIYSGDVIKTGATGSVQLRFIDKALMTIKANSEMDISSYQMGGEQQEEKAIMNLVKGGFRTITGSIGKGEKSAYKVNTPAASIGIRGTNYEVQQEPSGDFVMAVYSGGISVQNESGSLDLGLGSDFNFVRVNPKAAPKGLLAAPESLSANNATEQGSEDSSDDSSEEGEQVASNEDSDGEQEGQTEESGESEDSGVVASSDEEDEGGVLLAVAGDNDDSNEGAGTTDNVESDLPSDDQTQLTQLSEGTQEALEDVVAAVDSKLADTLDEDAKDMEEAVTQELIEGGYLQEGESLGDLADTVKDNLANIGDLDDLATIIDTDLYDLEEEGSVPDPDPTTDPGTDPGTDPDTGTTDFVTSLYTGLDTTLTNPFPTSVISNAEYSLVNSEKLAVMAMPLNYTIGADGNPVIQMLEAQLQSPGVIDTANFTAFDFSANFASVYIRYNVLDFSAGDPILNEYELKIPVDVSLGSVDNVYNLLDSAINYGFIESGSGQALEWFLNGQSQAIGETGIDGISLVPIYDESQTVIVGFTIQPSTTSTQFVSEMELHVSGDAAASAAFYDMIGGGSNEGGDDWYAQSTTEQYINSGAWRVEGTDSGSAVLMFKENRLENIDGTDVQLTISEIINKPLADQTVASLLTFASCGSNQTICDITVNSVAASERIRWGAWLAEPGEGINIYRKEEGVGINDTFSDSEEQILAFWLAAERADISQLTGTAQFTSTTNTNCLDYSQCLGFADDGIVQSVNGQFNVDFGTGAVTSGHLSIDITDDPNYGVTGVTAGTVLTTWDVNFSGQLTGGASGTEFTTNSINGTVTDAPSNVVISSQVVGNVGGIFVKPGDVFAGGFNVGTIDGTNKQTSGLFTFDKVQTP